MTQELTPPVAAILANMAYRAFDSDDMTDFQRNAAGSIPTGFAPTGALIKGRTGLTRVTNSAVVFDRAGTGGDEKVVSIRGTQGFPSQDWLSNINVGLVPGPTSRPCHAGFYFAYRSLRDEVVETVGRRPKTVHVVGHSLGGGQATLMALTLNGLGHSTYLYTFGAPRVGPYLFTRDLDQKFRGRLFRVFDPGDPVPMIPLFPFLHAPLSSSSFKSGGDRGSISSAFHSMDDWYIPSAEKAKTWEGMRTRFDSKELTYGFGDWLRIAGEATRIPMMGKGLWALGKLLDYIIKGLAMAVQAAFTAGLTVPDILAQVLLKGIELGGRMRERVSGWVRHAMRWLGLPALPTREDVTRTLLRHVLNMFFNVLARTARLALESIQRRAG